MAGLKRDKGGGGQNRNIPQDRERRAQRFARLCRRPRRRGGAVRERERGRERQKKKRAGDGARAQDMAPAKTRQLRVSPGVPPPYADKGPDFGLCGISSLSSPVWVSCRLPRAGSLPRCSSLSASVRDAQLWVLLILCSSIYPFIHPERTHTHFLKKNMRALGSLRQRTR